MIVVCYPYVPQRGPQKRKTVDLHKKMELRLKKVCYKVSFCENCQRQSCKAFMGLTIGAKMIGGGRPLLPEILSQNEYVYSPQR